MYTQYVSITGVNKFPTEKVKLYFSEKPTLAYEEIGLICIASSGFNNETKMIDKLRTEVMKRNGDAAINITMQFGKSNNLELSAVVIKWK